MFRRRRGLPLLQRRRVIVHTHNGGPTTQGVLVGTYEDCIVIAHGSELGPGGEGIPLDGDRVIPMVNVSDIDVVPAPSGAVV